MPTTDPTFYESGTRASASLTARHTSAPATDVISLLGPADKPPHNAGDARAAPNAPTSYYSSSYCSYSTESTCASRWLGDHLRTLAARFPDPSPFAILHERGWTFAAWCYLPAFGNVQQDLDSPLIAWLASIQAELVLDVYSFADDSPASVEAVVAATLSADS